jgi:hypothetical protein
MLEKIKQSLSEEEIQELQQYQYDETGVDEAIERVKEIDQEIERLKDLFNQRVEKLKFELEQKVKKLENKKQWDLYNLQQIVKNASDKKETKTQWKKQYLSGDVIIKKEQQKIVKPKLDEETIKTQFNDYKKEKIELNWKELKKDCVIKDGKVINAVTGEDLSNYITIEIEPEKVVIK